MTDPRTPEAKQREAQLPDDLDQNPAGGEAFAGHGSEDAQLIAGVGQAEGEAEGEASPDDVPRRHPDESMS